MLDPQVGAMYCQASQLSPFAGFLTFLKFVLEPHLGNFPHRICHSNSASQSHLTQPAASTSCELASEILHFGLAGLLSMPHHLKLVVWCVAKSLFLSKMSSQLDSLCPALVPTLPQLLSWQL